MGYCLNSQCTMIPVKSTSVPGYSTAICSVLGGEYLYKPPHSWCDYKSQFISITWEAPTQNVCYHAMYVLWFIKLWVQCYIHKQLLLTGNDVTTQPRDHLLPLNWTEHIKLTRTVLAKWTHFISTFNIQFSHSFLFKFGIYFVATYSFCICYFVIFITHL